MKLNPDCIRDILITVEANTDFNHIYTYLASELPNEHYLSKYSNDEVIYHISQCDKSNLIENVNYFDAGDMITISDLSPEGQEFLNNIREDTNWHKTKEVAGKIGSFSLNMLSQIATNIVTSLINTHTGLT